MLSATDKKIGIGGIVGLITISGFVWLFVKPVLQSSLTEAVAQEIVETQNELALVKSDVSNLTVASDRLYRIILQDEIDEEVEKISDLEFKRDFSDDDWLPEDQAKLNQAQQRLEAAQSALDDL